MGRLFTAIDFVYIVQTIEIYFVVDFALHIRFERNSAGEKWFSGREYNEIWKIPWDPLSREKTTFIFIKWQALDYYYYYYFRGDASRCLNFIRKKKSNSTWPKKFSFFFYPQEKWTRKIWYFGAWCTRLVLGVRIVYALLFINGTLKRAIALENKQPKKMDKLVAHLVCKCMAARRREILANA